ncbi:MAG: hypothetical protein RJQ04_13725 [Longimicrobiales bacterium]
MAVCKLALFASAGMPDDGTLGQTFTFETVATGGTVLLPETTAEATTFLGHAPEDDCRVVWTNTDVAFDDGSEVTVREVPRAGYAIGHAIYFYPSEGMIQDAVVDPATSSATVEPRGGVFIYFKNVAVETDDDQAPTAVLAAPEHVSFSESFLLDGTLSSDPGGGSIDRYVWTWVEGGVEVETTAPILLVPDMFGVGPFAVGRHTFELVVVDDSGNRSVSDRVIVIVFDDLAPTAVVQAPEHVPHGESFTLDGSLSSDAGGGSIARYLWTWLEGGLEVELDTPTLVVPDMLGVGPFPLGRQTFELVVVDDSGNRSISDRVLVVVVDDQAPTAVAHAPGSVPHGGSFTLDGSLSSDARGGSIARYVWTWLEGGLEVELDTPTLLVPDMLGVGSFPVGQVRFELVVVDDSGNVSAPSAVAVDIIPD